MTRSSATLAACALLASCAAPVPAVRSGSVKPATADQVARCAYIDDVGGASGWYGVFASQGIENARAEVLLKAEAIGATHIVWNPPTAVYGGTSVIGKAYRCAS